MGNANIALTSTVENKSDMIVSLSPLVFVCSCICLAVFNGTAPAQFGEYEHIASAVFKAQWTLWVSLPVSLLMMLFFGITSARSQLAALAVGTIGSLSLVSLYTLQLNWLVIVGILLAVLIPSADLLFKRLAP